MSLKAIKTKIISVNKTRKVTKAMESVSAVKMRKAQERALSSRTYARSALRILSQFAGGLDLLNTPLTTKSKKGRVAIVLVTSDKGLAGSLNSAVIKKAGEYISENNLKKNDIYFLCIGRRGYEFAQRNGYEVLYHEINISDDVEEVAMNDLTKKLIKLKKNEEIREARIVYTDFKSTFEQVAMAHKLLPLSRREFMHIVKDIVPTAGKYSSIVKDGQEEYNVMSYTIEPGIETVIEELLPRLVNITIFHKLLESKASEHSARMVAMKSATDKAGEISQELKLKFNKARQAAITSEVSEIIGGIEAMK